MLRRILNMFRSPDPVARRFVPSSANLPELWPIDATDPRLDVLDSASTQTLSELCDDYWNSFLAANDELYESILRDSRVQRRAIEIIGARGTDGLSWARARLSHDGYDAREDAASLIAQWAETDQLGEHTDAIAKELVTLAVTPPKEDTKEAQAAGAALRALSAIGGSACMAAVRHVLTSGEWDQDDNQWECVEILAKITNEPLMDSDDPVKSAKAWLDAHAGIED